MARFEKEKCYPITSYGLKKMLIDEKSTKIGKYMSVAIYGTLITLVIVGVLGQQFIITFIVGNVTSKTVKLLMA